MILLKVAGITMKFIYLLPNHVALCDTVNKCKSHLDKLFQYQDIIKLKFTELEVYIVRISYI